ncbi:MAG: FHA domain-containing protein [Anaerolineae bacterium]|nr:FHA domain-containing protein [Anaerolineae bacterium]
MAYGRLDVFWPDGMFKSFALVENNVSVGRSSGNTIAIESSTISRYHFSITLEGDQVFITDLESVNGTFVDSLRLKVNEPHPLSGGEEIQLGDLRIIYHQIDENPTQPIAIPEETTQRIELELPSFKIDVIGPDHGFSPGAHMSAELSITNTSDETCRYRVDVSGLPQEWVRIDRAELEIAPGDIAPVTINIRPLRRSESRPGDYVVLIGVAPKETPDARLEASLIVRILPYSGFGMALEQNRVSSGERFRLHVHNQGSAPLPLTISGMDKHKALRFVILAPQVSLTPGQRLVVQGEIRPVKPAWFGKPRVHPFDLQVRSADASRFLAVVRGQFIERPMLPAWTPLVLLAGALSLAGLLTLVVLLIATRPAPSPQIAAFSVNSTQVARGTALDLAWAVTNVSTLAVEVNGTPYLEAVSPQLSGASIDTSDYSGSVQIALLAGNGEEQARAEQSVYIYQPLGEGVFTADPQQLVRYVVQDLTISWSIPGAVTTRLTGLDAFSNTPVENAYGASGTVSGVVGIPAGPFTLTLLAEDEVGNLREQRLDVGVINPECLPAGQAITLRAGPDVRHQVISTVPASAIVVVDAQDSSGQWLRAQLPGNLSGWGQRTEFVCAQNFNVDDLYKELNVPTPVPPTSTPAPALTLTPTPTATRPQTLVPNVPGVTPTASG